jgi:hypothetical protein
MSNSRRLAATAIALPLALSAYAADEEDHRLPLLAEAQFPVTATRGLKAPDNHIVFGISGEHTNNATRAEFDGMSDTVLAALTSFGYSFPETRRASARIEGDLTYQEYMEDSQESELIAHASAEAAVQVVDDHLTWVVADELTQGRVDETEALTAANRQNVNLAMTGLRFATRIGDHNLLRVDGQYELSDYEVSSDGDSDALVGRVAWIRELGRRQALRLAVTARDVGYQGETLFPDYQGLDYAIAWGASGAYTDLTIEGGYTTIETEDNDTFEEPLYRVQLSRSLTQRLTLDVIATHELTGTSDAIHFDQTLGGRGPRTSEVAINPDPFVFDFAGVSLRFEGRRFAMEMGASTSRDRYTTSVEDDRDRVEATLRLDLLRGPRLRFGAFAQYEDETFVERDDAESTYIDFGLFASTAIGARTRLQVSVGRSERDTTFANGGYEENFGRLALMHSLGRGDPDSLLDTSRSRR